MFLVVNVLGAVPSVWSARKRLQSVHQQGVCTSDIAVDVDSVNDNAIVSGMGESKDVVDVCYNMYPCAVEFSHSSSTSTKKISVLICWQFSLACSYLNWGFSLPVLGPPVLKAQARYRHCVLHQCLYRFAPVFVRSRTTSLLHKRRWHPCLHCRQVCGIWWCCYVRCSERCLSGVHSSWCRQTRNQC